MSNSEYAIIGAMACLFVGWLLSRESDPVAPVDETKLEVVENDLEQDSLHREMLKGFRDTALQIDFHGKPGGFTMEEARGRREYLKGVEEDTVWMRLTKPKARRKHRYKKFGYGDLYQE